MSADDEPGPSFWHPTIRDGEFLVCDDEANATGWHDHVKVSARILRALLGHQAFPDSRRNPDPLDTRGLSLLLALLRDARAAKTWADQEGLWLKFHHGARITPFQHNPEHRDPWWPETLRLYREDEIPGPFGYRID